MVYMTISYPYCQNDYKLVQPGQYLIVRMTITPGLAVMPILYSIIAYTIIRLYDYISLVVHVTITLIVRMTITRGTPGYRDVKTKIG